MTDKQSSQGMEDMGEPLGKPRLEERMTFDDIAKMFGGEIPIEAMQFLFVSAPSDMTIREVRSHLEEMGERYRHEAELVERVAGAIWDAGVAPLKDGLQARSVARVAVKAIFSSSERSERLSQ